MDGRPRHREKPAVSQVQAAEIVMEADAVRIFRENWAIYRRVVERNYMAHDEIETSVRDLLAEQGSTGVWLDLGCGDAEMAARWLESLPAEAYHGVDLSGMALKEAEKRLRKVACPVFLHEAELTAFMGETELAFDTIVAGFSLHHLETEAKRRFLGKCRDRLSPGGRMVLYDIVCEPGEKREAYLERYFAWLRQTWTAFAEEELKLVLEHIGERDHPESVDGWLNLAEQAGFGKAGLVTRVAAGFHAVFDWRAL